MKYLEKIFNNEYAISLTPFQGEVSDFDEKFFEKVVADRNDLFHRAENYINEVIDCSKPLFEGGFILNSINMIGKSERSYYVEIEGYYEKDDHMYWSVTFNVPLVRADEESLEMSRYWPIEFKRRVE